LEERLAGHFIVDLDAGRNHLIALSSQGLVFTWGDTAYGQLGRRISERIRPLDHLHPYQVGTFTGREASKRAPIAYVRAGGNQSFAFPADGSYLLAWGSNLYGQCTYALTPFKGEHVDWEEEKKVMSPHLVGGLEDVAIADVATGDEHTLVLAKDGSVYSFGRALEGQLGLGVSSRIDVLNKNRITAEILDGVNDAETELADGVAQVTYPRRVPGFGPRSSEDAFGPAASIEAAGRHSMAVTQAGVAYAWGGGITFQLANAESGDINVGADEPSPKKMRWPNRLRPHLESLVVKVATGGQFTVIIVDKKGTAAAKQG
jgi:regulator of chromosome condensation